jgi:hypothetical protein
VPKVSMIETVVANNDNKNCLQDDIPLPIFRLLGVCSLIFIVYQKFAVSGCVEIFHEGHDR